MLRAEALAGLIIPSAFIITAAAAMIKKADIYSAFSQGVRESLDMICDIFPPVFALMIAVGMLRSSGLPDLFISFLSPALAFLKIPPEIIPQALLRPLSGSGSLALLSDTLKNHGPDSLTGMISCVLCGSTETTFYTLAVYFGGAGIKNTRYALKAALFADFISIAVSIAVCRYMFG